MYHSKYHCKDWEDVKHMLKQLKIRYKEYPIIKELTVIIPQCIGWMHTEYIWSDSIPFAKICNKSTIRWSTIRTQQLFQVPNMYDIINPKHCVIEITQL
jgi:hypothetical protein